jgi:hypothetical protein
MLLSSMNPKITHIDLCSLAQTLGYQRMGDGLCHGFSLMLAQALLAQDETTLYSRLHFIAKYHAKDKNFSSLIRDIAQVKQRAKTHKKLTDEEQQLLDVIAFFDGIALYQNPIDNLEVFNQPYVGQHNIEPIYNMTYPKRLGNVTLAKPFNRNFVFNKKQLKQFLTEFSCVLDKSKYTVPIILSGANHTVHFSLKELVRCESCTWDYVDINNFGYEATPDYFLTQTTDEITDSIFRSLSKDGHHVILHIDVLASAEDTEFIHACSKFSDGFHIHPADVHKYDGGNNLLHMACRYGDLLLIRQLCRLGVKLEQVNSTGRTPLELACIHNHLEAVKLLLEKGCKSDEMDATGYTILHKACLLGQHNILKHLLENGADVHKRNKDGVSLLSMAYFKRDSLLIREVQKHIAIQRVKHAIEALKQYAFQRKKLKRGEQAGIITNELMSLMDSYTKSKAIYTREGCEEFLNKCNAILTPFKQSKDFCEHRAYYKVVLANIAIALTGLGALLITAKLVHAYVSTGKFSTFFDKPQGLQHLEAIENTLHRYAPLAT